MNRPQFYWPTPDGYKDYPYVRPVPYDNEAQISIPPGQFLYHYVVRMDEDAPTIIRSLYVEGLDQNAQNINLHIQLRDAWGVLLTDDFVPLNLYAVGSSVTPPDGGSGRTKVFEPELYCPPGSNITFDLYNPI